MDNKRFFEWLETLTLFPACATIWDKLRNEFG